MHFSTSRLAREMLTGHSVVRLLIVSYFVALSLGVIEGVDVSVLAMPFLPGWLSGPLTSGMVLILSMMILSGWYRRTAALLLALMTFWASYVTMIRAPDQELGAFWRDLALIGALVLTYSGEQRPNRVRETARASDIPARQNARLSQAIASTRNVVSRPNGRTSSANRREQTDLFREDLDIVRAS